MKKILSILGLVSVLMFSTPALASTSFSCTGTTANDMICTFVDTLGSPFDSATFYASTSNHVNGLGHLDTDLQTISIDEPEFLNGVWTFSATPIGDATHVYFQAQSSGAGGWSTVANVTLAPPPPPPPTSQLDAPVLNVIQTTATNAFETLVYVVTLIVLVVFALFVFSLGVRYFILYAREVALENSYSVKRRDHEERLDSTGEDDGFKYRNSGS